MLTDQFASSVVFTKALMLLDSRHVTVETVVEKLPPAMAGLILSQEIFDPVMAKCRGEVREVGFKSHLVRDARIASGENHD